MARLACANVGNLSLQLLYKKHPGWRELPAAVVSKDSPYGTILAVNTRAGEYGIEPGQRYAGALSLNHELRADTVPAETVSEWVDLLAGELRRYSPHVEIDRGEPGIFWLEAGGMRSLYPDLGDWCNAIRRCLAERGFTAAVAVGFTRFGCYAAAKSIEDQLLYPNPRSERAYALKADISVLKLPAQAAERLEMLGIRTVGSFLELPPGAVGKRFGPEVKGLHRFAAGELEIPAQPAETRVDPQWVIKLPYAEMSRERLLETMRRSLENVTGELRKIHRLIRELRISLVLEGAAEEAVLIEPILPATPSVDTELLADLIALRMDNLRLPAAVAVIRMSAATIVERNLQSELFTGASKQSRKEVDRVLARLRGLWGNSCVQRARLEDEHIPERSYSWEDLRTMPWEGEGDSQAPAPAGPAASKSSGPGPLQAMQGRRAVRRIFAAPRPSPRQRYVLRGGPYPLSGHWWLGEKTRKYCYGETRAGEILWLCLDDFDGQWHPIGAVE